MLEFRFSYSHTFTHKPTLTLSFILLFSSWDFMWIECFKIFFKGFSIKVWFFCFPSSFYISRFIIIIIIIVTLKNLLKKKMQPCYNRYALFLLILGFLTRIKSMALYNGITLGPHKLHHDYGGSHGLNSWTLIWILVKYNIH